MMAGDFIRVYEKPLTDEDVEGVAALVKFVGVWDGDYERWLVRFKHEDGQYERIVHPRNLTGGRSRSLAGPVDVRGREEFGR